jgi:hypothetical protein
MAPRRSKANSNHNGVIASFYLPPDLVEQLRKWAIEEDRSASAIVRSALRLRAAARS